MRYSLIFEKEGYKVLDLTDNSSSQWMSSQELTNSNIFCKYFNTFGFFKDCNVLLNFNSLKELDNLQETNPELFI